MKGVISSKLVPLRSEYLRFSRLKNALEHIEVEASGFETAFDLARAAQHRKSRIFFIGNGGSAAIASHMAIDWMNKGQCAAMAFNDAAALTCFGNDYGYETVFERPLLAHARPGDLLFAISSSGKSSSIVGAASAMARSLDVVTLSGFAPDNPLRQIGRVNFYVPSDQYGVVEIAHLAICHSILDRLVA